MTAITHRMLGGSGRIYRWLTRGSARILMYHRFAQTDAGRRTSAAVFEQHVKFLLRHYRPCQVHELVEHLGTNGARARGLVAITVDDGYRDFLEVAYPILQRYRVPATLYVATDFIDQHWLRFDASRYLLMTAPEGFLRPSSGDRHTTVRAVEPPLARDGMASDW